MDWNKKVYPSDIWNFLIKPFRGIIENIGNAFGQVFEIRWKGAHEAWVRKDASDYTIIENGIKRQMKPHEQDIFDEGMKRFEIQMETMEENLNREMKRLERELEEIDLM